MRNDSTTLRDLSVFTPGEQNIFSLIDRTTTQAGRETLKRLVQRPPDSFEELQAMQQTVRWWTGNLHHWPEVVSNGTLVMLEKFFETADTALAPGSLGLMFGSFLQRLLNRNEYFFTQFSLSHITDFLNGCRQLTALAEGADTPELPPLLRQELAAMQAELDQPLARAAAQVDKQTPYRQLARLSHRVRRELKPAVLRLVQHYARLDAWQSMARATLEHRWQFPSLLPTAPIHLEATDLRHPLLAQPVSYTLQLGEGERGNFLVLTGANMSGKTTFMRAVGVGALLAHLGMGVPATAMKISFLEGVITNMHVEDNLLRGESYFYAEVQRMKRTAEQLTQPRPHLVLMDELFKGTNVHDAFECTRAVMEGLLQRPGHLMILATHLYEAAQQFRDRKGIQFSYFVTETTRENSFRFTYELRPGISSDRIGYRILQQAGVLDLLYGRKP
jgi:DNA mismatch repair protein MutS